MVDKSPDEARANAAKGSSNQTLNDMQEDFGLNGPYQIAKDGTNWILSGTENAKIPGRVYLYINSKGDYEVIGAEAVRS